MNPVVAAIREEINDALDQRTTALEQLETTTTRLKRLKETFEVFTGEQLDIEIPGLEATGEEDVAPDGDSNVTRIPVNVHLDGSEISEGVQAGQAETPADESPPQQETEAASEEPAVGSSASKRQGRANALRHIRALDDDTSITVKELAEDVEVSTFTARDAIKTAVAEGLLEDLGGRPVVYKRVTTEQPQPLEHEPPQPPEDPEPLYDPEPVAETVEAPAPPAEPIGEQEPPQDFVDQVFDVIKRNGPIPTHELPTITGIFDGHALKRATSKLDADGKIEWHDGAWQLAGTKDEQPEQETTEDKRHSPEQQKLRDDILHFIGTKPRTGGQLAELLSIPIKELHPTLEQLRDDGEIKQERLLKRWELA